MTYRKMGHRTLKKTRSDLSEFKEFVSTGPLHHSSYWGSCISRPVFRTLTFCQKSILQSILYGRRQGLFLGHWHFSENYSSKHFAVYMACFYDTTILPASYSFKHHMPLQIPSVQYSHYLRKETKPVFWQVVWPTTLDVAECIFKEIKDALPVFRWKSNNIQIVNAISQWFILKKEIWQSNQP